LFLNLVSCIACLTRTLDHVNIAYFISTRISLAASSFQYNITYVVHCFFIGELAPLLSVLGHEKHKRHKSARDFWPDWDAVLCWDFCLLTCFFLILSADSTVSEHLEWFPVVNYILSCSFLKKTCMVLLSQLWKLGFSELPITGGNPTRSYYYVSPPATIFKNPKALTADFSDLVLIQTGGATPFGKGYHSFNYNCNIDMRHIFQLTPSLMGVDGLWAVLLSRSIHYFIPHNLHLTVIVASGAGGWEPIVHWVDHHAVWTAVKCIYTRSWRQVSLSSVGAKCCWQLVLPRSRPTFFK
jgi:hypothetical protein